MSFPFENENGNDTIYFSETIASQLVPGGSGFGTFDADTTAASVEVKETRKTVTGDMLTAVDPGVIVRYIQHIRSCIVKSQLIGIPRYPRWGLRIHCAKLTDPKHM